MKYQSIIIPLGILGIFLLGACETPEGPRPNGDDEIAPGLVTVDEVVNISGGAVIYYTPPEDVDLLYIKAAFTDNRGIDREVKSSAANDSLLIQGLGEVKEYQVHLSAYDRVENQSEASTTTITPLEPPVRLIGPSLTGEVDYGGIKVFYENSMRAEVSLNMLVEDSLTGGMRYTESFLTSQESGSYSFRGYPPVKTRFGVYVEDRWENKSDTTYFEITPIPDDYVDKGDISVFKIQGDEDFEQFGHSAEEMWDDRWSDQWNTGHTDFAPLPHYLTLNLGVNVELSRFKLYQRGGDELYKHGNPKHFRVYGTLDVNDLPPYDPQDPNAGWTLLGEFHSFKPSGLPVGQFSSEDVEFQDKGEDFEFDVDNLVEIRYIRLEVIETWGNLNLTVIGELSFWGNISEQQQ